MIRLPVRGNARVYMDEQLPINVAALTDGEAPELRTLARCYADGVLCVKAADVEAVAEALRDLADDEAHLATRHRLREEHDAARVHRATRDGFLTLRTAVLRDAT